VSVVRRRGPRGFSAVIGVEIVLSQPVLLAAIGAVVAALIAAGFYVHDRQTRRLAWGAALWLALFLGYLGQGEIPLVLHTLPTAPLARIVVQAYDIVWWAVLAWLAVQLINVVLWRWLYPGAQPGGRKLIADVVSVLIYLGGLLAILSFTFEQDVSDVLATSGVVAIVLGLALQTSLGEIVSGLFMSVEAPYRAGDWITIDDKIEGQVVGTNWRATRLKTRTGDYLIVPNSTIAKANIVNRYFPDRIHTAQFTVAIDARTPPERAIAVLTAALLAAKTVRHEPPPEAEVWALGPKTIEYRLTYSVDDFATAPKARSEVAQRVWHHLAWAGIQMDEAAVPAPATAATEALRATALETALAQVPLFAPLSADERADLARRCRTETVPAGATLARQGAPGESMFLISEGVLAVRLQQGPAGLKTEIARLAPGETFGEISLLTGAPRTATVSALTRACVHELAKADLAPIMTARPELASELGRILATRQQELAEAARHGGGATETEESYAERIASWISAFFRS